MYNMHSRGSKIKFQLATSRTFKFILDLPKYSWDNMKMLSHIETVGLIFKVSIAAEDLAKSVVM